MVKKDWCMTNTDGAAAAGASSPLVHPAHAARVRCGDIMRDQEAERRTSPVAVRMKFTAGVAAWIDLKLPEDIEDWIVPYSVKVINQQVTQGKLAISEKEITGICSAIGQD